MIFGFLLAFSIAEENEKKEGNEVPQSWYREWVRSQENPYIQQRIKELGKKISLERGWGETLHREVGS